LTRYFHKNYIIGSLGSRRVAVECVLRATATTPILKKPSQQGHKRPVFVA
jgi:hypothetical protein